MDESSVDGPPTWLVKGFTVVKTEESTCMCVFVCVCVGADQPIV